LDVVRARPAGLARRLLSEARGGHADRKSNAGNQSPGKSWHCCPPAVFIGVSLLAVCWWTAPAGSPSYCEEVIGRLREQMPADRGGAREVAGPEYRAFIRSEASTGTEGHVFSGVTRGS